MSKYTTEVRFLCESLTGHTESVGFNDTDTVITQAAPLIFNFQYPIFDENYRIPLEVKILRHYYTREISEETYGLWKLRLEDRLNVIMPYYNQLYASTLLRFNPLYDVDLTTTHSGNENGVVNDDINERTNRNLNRGITINESVDEVLNKIGDNTANKNTSGENKGEEGVSSDRVKTGENAENKNMTKDSTMTHTGSITDENTSENKRVNNNTENEIRSENATRDKTTEYDEENEQQSRDNKSINSVENANNNSITGNTQWDLFSDTPQGGIDGIEGADNPSTQTLESKMFLTTARKITNNGTALDENTNIKTGEEQGNTNTSGTVGSDSSEQERSNIEGNSVNVKDGIETQNGSENNERTFDEANGENSGINEVNNNSYTEVNSDNENRQRKESSEVSEKSNQYYNETNVNNIGRNTSHSGNESAMDSKTGNNVRVSTNTDEYLQNVIGKSGGMTYSAMLLEYRETFINIDEMIIEELSDLFFGLW